MEIYQRHTQIRACWSPSELPADWGSLHPCIILASLRGQRAAAAPSPARKPCWKHTRAGSGLAGIICFGKTLKWHQLLAAGAFPSPVITCRVNHCFQLLTGLLSESTFHSDGSWPSCGIWIDCCLSSLLLRQKVISDLFLHREKMAGSQQRLFYLCYL